jgi:hypothetical protein
MFTVLNTVSSPASCAVFSTFCYLPGLFVTAPQRVSVLHYLLFAARTCAEDLPPWAPAVSPKTDLKLHTADVQAQPALSAIRRCFRRQWENRIRIVPMVSTTETLQPPAVIGTWSCLRVADARVRHALDPLL